MTKIPYPFPLLGGCYIEKLEYLHELNQARIDFVCINSDRRAYDKIVFSEVFSFLFRAGMYGEKEPYNDRLGDIYGSHSVIDISYLPRTI